MFLCNKEDEKLWPGLLKVKKQKIFKLGDVLSKLVLLYRFKDGGLDAKPPAPEAMEVRKQSPQLLENFGKKKLF